MKHTLTHLDPADLRAHAILKDVPHQVGDKTKFNALCDHVLERGTVPSPLRVTAHHQIVDLDSLDAWRAARQAQLESVPCLLVADDDVAGTFLHSLVNRRHYTKSQLAYVTYPLMKAAFEEAHHRKLELLKKGNVSRSPASGLRAKTVEELADQIGISRALFFDAARVHEAFAKDTKKHEFTDDDGTVRELTLREYFEPRILRSAVGGEKQSGDKPPMGLGAAIAGISGYKATGSLPKPEPRQLDLFNDVWETLRHRCQSWEQFNDAEKSKAVTKLRASLKAMPDDLLDQVISAAREAKKHRKEDGE